MLPKTTGGMNAPLAEQAPPKKCCGDPALTAKALPETFAYHELDYGIEVGELLGSGAFCSVYSVSFHEREEGETTLVGPGNNELNLDPHQDPAKPGDHQYAMKKLHERTLANPKKTAYAEKDLRSEVKILMSLPRHVNVIYLHCVSANFQECPAKGFMVLDMVQSTLDGRIEKWTRESRNSGSGGKGPFGFLKKNRKNDRINAQRTRIKEAALGLSRAMRFLHEHAVLFRDLKPANVGFDAMGEARLFDFGFARIHPDFPGGETKLTGRTGTLRYMAPEVAKSKDYGFPADVHSFAVLMWQIVTLQKPYGHIEGADMTNFQLQAFDGGLRPPLRPVLTESMKDLLGRSWDPSPTMRPTFCEIVQQLEAETALLPSKGPASEDC